MKLILGEKREIKIVISSMEKQPFTIRNASYRLIKRGTGTVVEDGSCTVEEHEISAIIQPTEDGSFIIEFSYEIANEILKAVVPIEVKHYAST